MIKAERAETVQSDIVGYYPWSKLPFCGILIYFSSIVKQAVYAYVNHSRIRSCNQRQYPGTAPQGAIHFRDICVMLW